MSSDVQEHHGCACRGGNVTLLERRETIKISADFNAELEPAHARYLARKLYHLARKIESRSQFKETSGK